MEERINKLENQLKAALEELESIKKELAEEKAKNAELTKENESLKVQIKEWQIKYEEEHKLVIKLTEENERLKAHIVELENQLKTEDEKPYDVADMHKYMQLQNSIRELESKLETLDARERKADAKLLNMIQETKSDVTEMKDTVKACTTEVSDSMCAVDDLARVKPEKVEVTVEEEKTHNDPSLFADVKPEMQGDDYLAFYDSLE